MPQPTSSTRRGGGGSCDSTKSMSSATGVEVTQDEARRIAVRAQLRRVGDRRPGHRSPPRLPPDRSDLRGRAAATSRPLEPASGRSTGRSSTACCGRRAEALRVERVHLADRGSPADPGTDARALGPLQARAVGDGVPKEQSSLRRYVLRELERRGPLLSRELEHTDTRATSEPSVGDTRPAHVDAGALAPPRAHRCRRPARNHRLWDLAERWYPKAETVPAAAASAPSPRSGSAPRREAGEGPVLAHPDADTRPVGRRITFLSPFDRLIHDRARAEALWNFGTASRCTYRRRSASTATTSCRSSAATTSWVGSSPSSTARRVLRVNGVWWEPGSREVSLDRPRRACPLRRREQDHRQGNVSSISLTITRARRWAVAGQLPGAERHVHLRRGQPRRLPPARPDEFDRAQPPARPLSRLGNYNEAELERLALGEPRAVRVRGCDRPSVGSPDPQDDDAALSRRVRRRLARATERLGARQRCLCGGPSSRSFRKYDPCPREIEDIAEASWRPTGWTDRNVSRMLEFMHAKGEVVVAVGRPASSESGTSGSAGSRRTASGSPSSRPSGA